MSAPLPPRLRVVVMGNSTAMYVRPRRRVREDGPYAQLLEERLRAKGSDVSVVNEGRWYEMLPEGFRRWQGALYARSPDVVILNYGLADCQPRIVPTWLFRQMFTWRPNRHPAAKLVRRRVLIPLQRLLVYAMPRVSKLIGTRTWRVRPSYFEHELRRMLLVTRMETGALVLVLTLNPPGPFLQRFMPDIEQRAARFDGIIRDTVAAINDPGVRLVDAGAVVEKLGWRKAMLDGLHYTALGHREVASLLEEEIDTWLEASRRIELADVQSDGTAADREALGPF